MSPVGLDPSRTWNRPGQIYAKLLRSSSATHSQTPHLLGFLAADDLRQHSNYRTVWNELRRLVSNMPTGSTEHIGPGKHKGTWSERTTTTKGDLRARLLCVARFFGENHLQLGNVCSVRVANGSSALPSVTGYSKVVTMMWSPLDGIHKFVEQESDEKGIIPSLNIRKITDMWSHMRIVRFHLIPDEHDLVRERGRDEHQHNQRQ